MHRAVNPSISQVRTGRALGVAVLFTATFLYEHAVAAVASEVLANCRATIGRPVVQACVQERLHAQGGLPIQHVPACRKIASPAVRGCFQTAMKDVIAGCRASVGKPIVQACVGARVKSEGRFLFEYVATCRKFAYDEVRACVWRTAAGGG